MGRRAGGRDFAPRVRSAVDRVLEELEKNGDADKLIKAQLENDFAGTIAKFAAYTTKHIDITTESIEDYVSKKTSEQVAIASETTIVH
jgi:hypothetical protein